MKLQTVAALGRSAQPQGSQVQWLVNRERVPGALGMLMVQALTKGAELAAHRLPSAESVTFLLSGKGEWLTPDQSWRLNPGEGVYNPPGTRRAFTAGRDEDAVMLVVYGGTTDPRDAEPHPAHGVAECGCRVARKVDTGNSSLQEAGGFIDMGVHWLATTETVGTRKVVVATSTFTPGGSHQLHRHPNADEFFLVLQGSGEHLTQNGPVRMNPGDIVYIPANEWHGYRTDPGVTTRTVYGYLGAGSLEQAGYELLEEKT